MARPISVPRGVFGGRGVVEAINPGQDITQLRARDLDPSCHVDQIIEWNERDGRAETNHTGQIIAIEPAKVRNAAKVQVAEFDKDRLVNFIQPLSPGSKLAWHEVRDASGVTEQSATAAEPALV